MNEITNNNVQESGRECFCIRPLLAKTSEMNLLSISMGGTVVSTIFTVLFVGFAIQIYFFDNAIYYYPMIEVIIQKTNDILVLALVILLMWGICGIIKYGYYYMKYTKYSFCQNAIRIYRFRKSEKVITYEEVKEQIKKKKIKVHNGRFEIPYKNGYIPVYTWGDEIPSSSFYQFINAKCGTSLPNMRIKDNDIVRKSGIGWAMRKYFALPMFGFAVYAGIGGAVGDCGIESGLIKMMNFFLQYFFSPINIFGFMGLVVFLLGSMITVRNFFTIKKHFNEYEDIKVTLF